MLYPGVYANRSLALDYTNRCVAAALFVNRRGVLSGVSAAHLWGADLRPRGATLVEVTVPGRAGPRSRSGLTIVHSPLLAGDVDLLVGGGLPPPVSQYDVFDEHGRWVGRVDLAYPAKKVGIEYEGARHRDADVFQHDLRRLNRLRAAGWRILRYGPGDVFNREHQIVAEVRSALR